MKKLKKTAFTLAEVLITLAIIGIVAAITIPILFANYQKQQWVTQLQKSYTTFNQALVQIASDYGCAGNLACTGLFDTGTTIDIFGDQIVKYFKVVKNCQTSGVSLGCWSNSSSTNYDGSGTRYDYDSSSGRYKFVGADGATYYMATYASGCSTSRGTNSMSQVCAWLWVDVNGMKPPNNQGRDIFEFYITNGKGPLLYPYGGKDHTGVYYKDTGTCTPTNPEGYACTAKIMEDSWQMNY